MTRHVRDLPQRQPATGKPSTHMPTTASCDSLPHHDRLRRGPIQSQHGRGRDVRDLPQRLDGDRQVGQPHPDDGELRHLPRHHAFVTGRFDHSGVRRAPARPATTAAARPASPRTMCRRRRVCDNCHTTTAFAGARFNHSTVPGTCATCHNGSTATGKPTTHIPTTASCDTCHSTTAFARARFDHSTVTRRDVRDLPQRQPRDRQAGQPHSDDGELRYLPLDRRLAPAQFNHSGVAPGTCATCHNGTRATGKTDSTFRRRRPAIPATTRRPWPARASTTPRCSAPARPATTAPRRRASRRTTSRRRSMRHLPQHDGLAPARFNHTGVTPGTCATCHNGTPATGKPSNHMPTTAAATPATRPSPGRRRVRPRRRRPGTCGTCHNGTRDRQEPAAHPHDEDLRRLPQHDGLDPALRFDHADVLGTCARCHNGTTATGKPANHIPTTHQCDDCHVTAWPPARSTTSASPGNCASCHNGTQATGKTRTTSRPRRAATPAIRPSPGRRRSSTTPMSRRAPASSATTARRRPARIRSTSARPIPAMPATAPRPGRRRCASTTPRCSAPARAATTAPRRPASRRRTSRPRSSATTATS